MSATRILWGQVVAVIAVVLAAIWTATEWTAWRLRFQPELGRPWSALLHFPVYQPPAFFGWWYTYDAYAPLVFIKGARTMRFELTRRNRPETPEGCCCRK